jgi:hypothetical protein
MKPSDAAAELARALAMLEQGREGASPEWLRAAMDYVERCRREVERGQGDVATPVPDGAVMRDARREWPPTSIAQGNRLH